MRVAFVLMYFQPDLALNRTGTQQAVLGLASGMAEAGADVTVIASSRLLAPGQPHQTVYAPNFRRIGIDDVPSWQQSVSSMLINRAALQKIVEQLPQDTVYILNGLFHLGAGQVAKSLIQMGRRYVIWPHARFSERLFLHGRSYVKRLYWSLFEKHAFNQAMAVQLFTDEESAYVKKFGVKTPTITVPNGAPSALFKVVQPVAARSACFETPHFFHFGRIDFGVKAIDVLMEAWALLAPHERPLLTLQGPVSDHYCRVVLNNIQQNGLTNCVQLLPPDFETPANQLLSKYPVFLLCSRTEAFSIAACQAMAVGMAMLVSENNGHAGIVKRNQVGVVVPTTVQGIVGGVRDMMARQHEWRDMASRAQRFAFEHLQWSGIAKRLLAEYQRLLT